MLKTVPKIAIIGAGKLTYSLTDALVKSKYKIDIVISKNPSSAILLAQKYRIRNHSRFLNNIPISTNIFFLTVPDDQISSAANQLAKLQFDFRESIFVHFSGAKNVSALKSLQDKKAHTASFHIMQTFPSKIIVKLNNCLAAIETQSGAAKKFLEELATKLHLNAFYLNSNEKVKYHLAGVFASNFLVSNLFSTDLLLGKVSKRTNSYEIMAPILNSTLKNVKVKGAKEALSGPIIRGDFETIKAHSAFLKKLMISENKRLSNRLHLNYLVQSLSLIEIVRSKNGKLNLKQKQIEKFLVNESKRLARLL